ncbi:undecaprenyldiphospho-muramoylpentapeptide beta-N-acetylglucosaminyltransferase [Riemerella anatipestifer]|uniref:UDP-N-acetylglucosamine--N-acetylmuramyl-(pentapeptide) pyrophosphoryl-undecaprenol N-acetylglucosamine transferase n=1 Tax=Riemerella anatipestifer (strain ATCC 11845 / DSM 15868 / JCM 9532 / NCTC 11014) TaxID=693978 RepID=E4TA42_RIEAD|nr:undecaprenyldiphospho-muramoylpentapeptide beta-N-acetylglucosaminyltransferase [Riemerella anatipestifer]ADQ82202.1 UDP-N-acetylglucosamine--N-acetylmuramyl-(pentapeptide) pyrophosphoryl-undecaprenol N-acetylglucosamine transferase [Riemerella anatipestifer ATCC 11845 = DSM 15868]ADZ12294.1 UDP-N-acetylglucosamine:LPS N-acetylglucosamine transferase [Riemerella anatipestifer RA-GD]AFD56202.1 udp-n-acetylglucosamine--n-acetylmuramyl-(pentapeptide) pyrophosphoryl-undecaprenol n-acetylglucosami
MSENIHHINQDFAPRVLMSGGGTGGHIFPAIAIAQEIQKRFPKAEFLFIGAENKMEMEKVPQAGFRIEGLNISGFNRSSLLANFKLPFKIISSVRKANRIIKDFKPHVAIGTGGFASGPALYIASRLGVPTFVQEQNSLPGKTNLFLGKKAKAVFTAYPDMVHFFPKTQTIFSGNPIRQSLMEGLTDTATAKEKLGLDPSKLSILSVGGSLGSRTLNNGWLENLERIKKEDWQLIWQTGKTEYQTIKDKVNLEEDTIQIKEFITDMALAYSAADVIVSRAGAIAISELAVVKKPILLVPLPFAAEDHQTKNAMVLVEKNAARMVKDEEMKERFWNTLSEICSNENLRKEMGQNLSYFAKPKATEEIVDEIIKVFK